MKEKIEIIEYKLTDINKELLRKFGSDSYAIRCAIFDIKSELSKLRQPTVISTVCKNVYCKNGRVLMYGDEYVDCPWCKNQTDL